MKAKELAIELMKNPEAIVSVWHGDPSDIWVEINRVEIVDNEYCLVDETKKYERTKKQVQLGSNE
jgi:hypothetical protein